MSDKLSEAVERLGRYARNGTPMGERIRTVLDALRTAQEDCDIHLAAANDWSERATNAQAENEELRKALEAARDALQNGGDTREAYKLVLAALNPSPASEPAVSEKQSGKATEAGP